MFGIPGKQAVTLTPTAAAHIRRLMERDGHQGLHHAETSACAHHMPPAPDRSSGAADTQAA
jgi:hypothetical protein